MFFCNRFHSLYISTFSVHISTIQMKENTRLEKQDLHSGTAQRFDPIITKGYCQDKKKNQRSTQY